MALVFPNVLPNVAAAAICVTMVLSSESKPCANNPLGFVSGAYPCCPDVDPRIPTAMSWRWNKLWTNVLRDVHILCLSPPNPQTLS